ncbi:GntR family transcriptional regulator [Histidinibacterium aquaticum]|uniref:GntR family transcriptional regulator n=2 Tax=Histidinibacterium aquaticum TaxID=2613962 RepID=A0A5J5GL64_9RHOB|nr:GntR family transcriptional regulator [Histidinibacterium aquaticum]
MAPSSASSSALRPDRARGLHDYLVAGIRDMILKGELEAGARLGEADLCGRFEVSRTPLREALKALSGEGLVLLQPNRGATVAPLDPVRLRDVFEAKGAIEHFIGLNAAVRASDAEIAGLQELHEALVAAEEAEAPQDYTELNEAYHLELARLAGNEELLKTYERLQHNILRARHRINDDPSRVRASLAEHERIMLALTARARLDLAERLVAHNEATAAAVLAKIAV